MAVTQCFAWKQHDGQWAFPDFLRKQSPLLLQVGSAKNWNWIFCFSANRRLCNPCLRLLNGCMPRNRRLPYNEALKHFLILMVYLLIRVEKIEHLVSLIALPSISRKWTGGGGGWGGWRGCGRGGGQEGGRGGGWWQSGVAPYKWEISVAANLVWQWLRFLFTGSVSCQDCVTPGFHLKTIKTFNCQYFFYRILETRETNTNTMTK